MGTQAQQIILKRPITQTIVVCKVIQPAQVKWMDVSKPFAIKPAEIQQSVIFKNGNLIELPDNAAIEMNEGASLFDLVQILTKIPECYEIKSFVSFKTQA